MRSEKREASRGGTGEGLRGPPCESHRSEDCSVRCLKRGPRPMEVRFLCLNSAPVTGRRLSFQGENVEKPSEGWAVSRGRCQAADPDCRVDPGSATNKESGSATSKDRFPGKGRRWTDREMTWTVLEVESQQHIRGFESQLHVFQKITPRKSAPQGPPSEPTPSEGLAWLGFEFPVILSLEPRWRGLDPTEWGWEDLSSQNITFSSVLVWLTLLVAHLPAHVCFFLV